MPDSGPGILGGAENPGGQCAVCRAFDDQGVALPGDGAYLEFDVRQPAGGSLFGLPAGKGAGRNPCTRLHGEP